MLGKFHPGKILIDMAEHQLDFRDHWGVSLDSHRDFSADGGSVLGKLLDFSRINQRLPRPRQPMECRTADLREDHFFRKIRASPTRIPAVCAIPSMIRLAGMIGNAG